MFRCERCGTDFSAARVPRSDHCPRCLARDGVRSPLVFKFSVTPPPSAARALPRLERVGVHHR